MNPDMMEEVQALPESRGARPDIGGILGGLIVPDRVGKSRARFLNAAYGYPAFTIRVNRQTVVQNLDLASITGYMQIPEGFQTITVAERTGYIYLQKTMPFRRDDAATIAIINTSNGIDLIQIQDVPCNQMRGMACIRVSNLAYNSGPLDFMLADGRVVYSDVRFKETTAFKRIRPGVYEFYLADTSLSPVPRNADIEPVFTPYALSLPDVLLTFGYEIRQNTRNTMFILRREDNPNAFQILPIADAIS